ncbi:MAG: spore coat associated protein CotJA [Ruminococcus sp.]|nr:spore coat associated protein CotJA [Ruminococcus sp.]MBQ1615837.1 spore coat associated protein CotJA [Ruminococcus sp.]MBQ4171251.1 spore coat associated protein CotJA [Ruminococcus sp.]
MLPEKPVYAMAYVPFQAEQPKLYSPDQGLVAGTMFQKLDKPFFGSQCGEKS